MTTVLHILGYLALAILIMVAAIYGLLWAVAKLLDLADPWEDDDEAGNQPCQALIVPASGPPFTTCGKSISCQRPVGHLGACAPFAYLADGLVWLRRL